MWNIVATRECDIVFKYFFYFIYSMKFIDIPSELIQLIDEFTDELRLTTSEFRHILMSRDSDKRMYKLPAPFYFGMKIPEHVKNVIVDSGVKRIVVENLSRFVKVYRTMNIDDDDFYNARIDDGCVYHEGLKINGHQIHDRRVEQLTIPIYSLEISNLSDTRHQSEVMYKYVKNINFSNITAHRSKAFMSKIREFSTGNHEVKMSAIFDGNNIYALGRFDLERATFNNLTLIGISGIMNVTVIGHLRMIASKNSSTDLKDFNINIKAKTADVVGFPWIPKFNVIPNMVIFKCKPINTSQTLNLRIPSRIRNLIVIKSGAGFVNVSGPVDNIIYDIEFGNWDTWEYDRYLDVSKKHVREKFNSYIECVSVIGFKNLYLHPDDSFDMSDIEKRLKVVLI